jgi:ElaB/YqjD/DUF883 family membrane-anchored ribosome-binding protein
MEAVMSFFDSPTSFFSSPITSSFPSPPGTDFFDGGTPSTDYDASEQLEDIVDEFGDALEDAATKAASMMEDVQETFIDEVDDLTINIQGATDEFMSTRDQLLGILENSTSSAYDAVVSIASKTVTDLKETELQVDQVSDKALTQILRDTMSVHNTASDATLNIFKEVDDFTLLTAQASSKVDAKVDIFEELVLDARINSFSSGMKESLFDAAILSEKTNSFLTQSTDKANSLNASKPTNPQSTKSNSKLLTRRNSLTIGAVAAAMLISGPIAALPFVLLRLADVDTRSESYSERSTDDPLISSFGGFNLGASSSSGSGGTKMVTEVNNFSSVPFLDSLVSWNISSDEIWTTESTSYVTEIDKWTLQHAVLSSSIIDMLDRLYSPINIDTTTLDTRFYVEPE